MDDADQYWQERDQDELYEFEQWLRDGGYEPNVHENRERDLEGPSSLLYFSQDPKVLPAAIWVCSGQYGGVSRLIERKQDAVQRNPLLQQCRHVIASPDDIASAVRGLGDDSDVWDADIWRARSTTAYAWPRGVAELYSRLMHELPRGTKGSYRAYETLATEMVRFIFDPELHSPTPQSTNLSGTQRRDAVFKLHPDFGGIWASITQKYPALNVVMEAKNHDETLGAPTVSSIAAYLGSSPGPIAILASRLGVNESGHKQIREIAMRDSKLILSISDRDFRELLFARVKDLQRPRQRREVDRLLGTIASASTL